MFTFFTLLKSLPLSAQAFEFIYFSFVASFIVSIISTAQNEMFCVISST